MVSLQSVTCYKDQNAALNLHFEESIIENNGQEAIRTTCVGTDGRGGVAG